MVDGWTDGRMDECVGGVVAGRQATCMLKSGAVCSPVQHACCTDSCQFVPFTVDSDSNQLCRASTGSCDSPEYCHGDTAACPEDIGVVAGVRARSPCMLVVATSFVPPTHRRAGRAKTRVASTSLSDASALIHLMHALLACVCAAVLKRLARQLPLCV